MSLQVANHARALPGYPFDVRTLRSNSDNNRFWWMARDVYGKIIETSSTTYKTETEARRPADAVAGTIRRRVLNSLDMRLVAELKEAA
jgi:hypothetical protein